MNEDDQAQPKQMVSAFTLWGITLLAFAIFLFLAGWFAIDTEVQDRDSIASIHSAGDQIRLRGGMLWFGDRLFLAGLLMLLGGNILSAIKSHIGAVPR